MNRHNSRGIRVLHALSVSSAALNLAVAVPGVGHAPTLVEPVTLAALEHFLGVLSPASA